MRSTRTRGTRKLGFLVATLSLLSGCGIFKQGLVGEERANVVPFAEHTVSALTVDRLDFRQSEFTYLRALVGSDWPEVRRLRERLAVADGFRDDVIRYSVELVRIGESNATDAERVREFADMLIEVRQGLSDEFDASDSEFAATVADIRAQPNLLAALRSTQPLIDEASKQYLALIDEIESETLVAAVAELDRAIEQSYANFMHYSRLLAARREGLLQALSLIREIRLGSADAVAELRSLDVFRNRQVRVADTPTAAQIAELENHILAEMERDNRVGEYMDPDVVAYLAIRAELDREEAEVLAGLNVARLQIVGWARAHQAMANGAKEPGKWLSVVADAARTVRGTR